MRNRFFRTCFALSNRSVDKKKSITSELSNKFVFSNSDRILKKYPVFGEKVKAWNIISTDKELKLAIFSTDANKFKHFNIRKNKTAPNSDEFVSKSIKHLLDIGYMKKKTFQHVYCYSQKLISKLSTAFNFYVIHIPFNYYTYKTLEQKKL